MPHSPYAALSNRLRTALADHGIDLTVSEVAVLVPKILAARNSLPAPTQAAVILQVTDLDEAVAWYETCLGFSVIARDTREARLALDEVQLVLTPHHAVGRASTLLVSDPMALFTSLTRSYTAGAGGSVMLMDNHDRLDVVVKDPAGNTLHWVAPQEPREFHDRWLGVTLSAELTPAAAMHAILDAADDWMPRALGLDLVRPWHVSIEPRTGGTVTVTSADASVRRDGVVAHHEEDLTSLIFSSSGSWPQVSFLISVAAGDDQEGGPSLSLSQSWETQVEATVMAVPSLDDDEALTSILAHTNPRRSTSSLVALAPTWCQGTAQAKRMATALRSGLGAAAMSHAAALECVARAIGHRNWNTAAAHLSCGGEPTPRPAAVPVVRVHNFDIAAALYCDELGFAVTAQDRHDMTITRDDVTLVLTTDRSLALFGSAVRASLPGLQARFDRFRQQREGWLDSEQACFGVGDDESFIIDGDDNLLWVTR